MGSNIEDVVQGHTVQMVMMSGKLDNITDSMNDMKIILREISSTQKEMAILMERVENHEENTKKNTDDVRESFKAVNARITRIEDDHAEHKKTTTTKCEEIGPKADKGASVHKMMVNAAIGLAISVAGVIGVIIIWAIEQGGAK